MKKYFDNVNYSLLSETELKFKACIDLFTIFFLNKNRGLTDIEIYEYARCLGMSGYDGMVPDCIVRSNIYRWNDISDSLREKTCENPACEKYANYGIEWNKPILCRKHAKSENSRHDTGYTLVIEERLYRAQSDGTTRKGKYYLDPLFYKRIKSYMYNEPVPLVPIAPIVTSVDVISNDIYNFDDMEMF
jgi:hypothetical protein